MSTLDTLDPMTEFETVPGTAWTQQDAPEGGGPVEQDLTSLDAPLGRRFDRDLRLGRLSGHDVPDEAPIPRSDADPGAHVSPRTRLASLPMPLADLVEEALDAVAKALDEPPLDEELWGPEAAHADIVHAAIGAAVTDWQEKEGLRQKSLASRDAASRLGVDLETLRRRATANEFVAFDHAGDLWLPVWQFEAGVPLDLVSQVWQRFPGDAIWFSEWVQTPNPGLDGRAPVDRLRDSDLEAVLAAVEALTQ